MSEKVSEEKAPARRDPERTRRRLLDAATGEFATNGLEGSRVDEIARKAGVNKQLVYHYFGSKDKLYLAVLENEYTKFRQEGDSLDFTSLSPAESIRRLVEATFDSVVKFPKFVTIVADENFHDGRHVRESTTIRDMHEDLIDRIAHVLKKGENEGVFRPRINPVDFYISLAAMCSFYVTNARTLSAIFDRDLSAAWAAAGYRQHLVELVLGGLRPRD